STSLVPMVVISACASARVLEPDRISPSRRLRSFESCPGRKRPPEGSPQPHPHGVPGVPRAAREDPTEAPDEAARDARATARGGAPPRVQSSVATFCPPAPSRHVSLSASALVALYACEGDVVTHLTSNPPRHPHRNMLPSTNTLALACLLFPSQGNNF